MTTESPRASVSSRLAMLQPVRDLSESRVLVSMVLGCVLTAVFYLVGVNLLFPGTYMASAFSERGIIPYLTTFLCGTGIFLLVFSSLRILREENAFEFIRTVISQHSPLDRDGAREALRGVRKARETHGGIVTNRFLRSLQAVEEGVRSKSELGDTLRGLGEIDESIVEAAHLPVKFIIWLIPVLGFTGTVLGISSAISGFSTLIAGAADFAAAKGALGGVTTDLGVAFETTLLALIKTAFLMYGFSMLQKRERSFFIHIDEYCADDMLKKVVAVRPPESDKTEVRQLTEAVVELHDSIASWDPRFREVLEAHFKRLEALGGRLDTTLERRREELFEGLKGLGAVADERAAARIGELSARCDAADQLAATRLAEFKGHCDAADAYAATRLAEFRGHCEAADGFAATRLAEFKGHCDATDELVSAQLAELEGQGAAANACAAARLAEFRSHCDAFVEASSEASTRSVDAASNMAESVERFATVTARVDSLQTGLNETIQALTKLEEFNRCLDALRESTTTLPGVLRDLSRPRTITLVEAREDG